MPLSENKSKKSISSIEEKIESEKILSSSSKWNLDNDKLFVICLNDNSKNKIVKTIENYLDLSSNTILNHMSIRSRLVSQPKNKLISNDEKLFNAINF